MSQGSGSVVFSRKTHFYCFLATERFLYNSSQVKTDTYFFVFFSLKFYKSRLVQSSRDSFHHPPFPTFKASVPTGKEALPGNTGEVFAAGKKGGLCLTFGGKLEESRKSSFLEEASGR